jgi:hypothetical protein
MSHIPSSAMKHAGPIHHDEAKTPPKPPKSPKPQPGGLGTGAWLAIGGTILAGAAAAIARQAAGRDAPRQEGQQRQGGEQEACQGCAGLIVRRVAAGTMLAAAPDRR